MGWEGEGRAEKEMLSIGDDYIFFFIITFQVRTVTKLFMCIAQEEYLTWL